MDIYTVVYRHRFGTDSIPCISQEVADESALNIVRAWRKDFNVPDGISDQQARDEWITLTNGDEDIDIRHDTLAKTPAYA